MLGQPWIGHYLLHFYLALVLLDSGGLEADKGASVTPVRHRSQGGISGQALNKGRLNVFQSPSTINDKVQMLPHPSWTGASLSSIHLTDVVARKIMQKRDFKNSHQNSEPLQFNENNAQTTTVTGTDNNLLNQSVNQTIKHKVCLPSQAEEARCSSSSSSLALSAAQQICSSRASARVHRLLYHPSFSSRCWQPGPGECPPPVLDPGRLLPLLGNDTEACVSAAVSTLCDIAEVNRQIERVEEVMESGFCGTESPDDLETLMACDEDKSSSFTRCTNCRECKKWVVSWMCMSLWPLWLGSTRTTPCPAVCSLVQEHCPFNIILEDASTASGDPTFLCQDPVIVENTSSYGNPECCFLPLNMSQERQAADPPAGGYVDLNATYCSAMLSNATPHCDTSYTRRLTLANRTLILKQVAVVSLDSNWFWDLVTSHTGSGSGVRCCMPLLLICLMFSSVYTRLTIFSKQFPSEPS